MRNYFLISIVGFIIWAAATGRLQNWFALASGKVLSTPSA